MSNEGLKKLFIAFNGDTGKINFYLKQLGDAKALGKALADANWSGDLLDGRLLKKRQTALDVSEKTLSDDAVNRATAAAAEAKEIIKQDNIGKSEVKRLLLEWLILEKEFMARNLADPSLRMDLSFMEMSPPPAKGDFAANNTVSHVVDDLLDQEPVIIMTKKVAEFRKKLVAAQKSLKSFFSMGGKDSWKKTVEIEGWAAKMAAELNDIYNKSAPEAKKMEFAQQYMVPSAQDMAGIKQRLAEVDGIRTESQAWALEGAEKKGTDELPANRIRALERLIEIGKSSGAKYGEEHLDVVLKYLASGKLATNYFLADAPGANLDIGVAKLEKATSLGQLLMTSDHFKNVWETGQSQASADLAIRGGVEEQMGYSMPLGREEGLEHTVAASAGDVKTGQKTSKFRAEGAGQDPDEMPKYAAIISDNAKDGVAKRYGGCIVLWKDEVRERVTHTPGDSWSNEALGMGAKNFTSNSNPEVLLANGDAQLVRLAAAEATGKDQAFAKKIAKDGFGDGYGSYIETQIHGDLTWDDVDTLVLGGTDEEVAELQADFEAFKKKESHNFTIKLK